jgi:hypothetical protein
MLILVDKFKPHDDIIGLQHDDVMGLQQVRKRERESEMLDLRKKLNSRDFSAAEQVSYHMCACVHVCWPRMALVYRLCLA